MHKADHVDADAGAVAIEMNSSTGGDSRATKHPTIDTFPENEGKMFSEERIFHREPAKEVMRWDYSLCWAYNAISNIKKWDDSGWIDGNERHQRGGGCCGSAEEESPLKTITFESVERLGFEVKDGVVSAASIDARAKQKGVRPGWRVVQIGNTTLKIQDRSKPGKFKPSNAQIDGNFQAVCGLYGNSPQIKITFMSDKYSISPRAFKNAAKYIQDEDEHRQVFVSQVQHEIIKKVKRARLCYKLKLEYFEDDMDMKPRLAMDGVLFLLVGVSERRALEEVSRNPNFKFELDPSMCRRYMRREQGLQLGDSAFVTLYLDGCDESIVYNVNRRATLDKIKSDMLVVLRDMVNFRKVLMDKMGLTHDEIFYGTRAVARRFKLYMIDRHFVQGRFDYNEIYLRTDQMVRENVMDGSVFLFCATTPQIDDFSTFKTNPQLFSKYALRSVQNPKTGSREPILPDRVVSNFVDDLEIEKMIELPMLGELGHRIFKQYPISGGERLYPTDANYAIFHAALARGYGAVNLPSSPKTRVAAATKSDDVAKATQKMLRLRAPPYYKVYRPNPKMIDAAELPVGAQIFGRPPHDKSRPKIHANYDEKKGGDQYKECPDDYKGDRLSGGTLGSTHRLDETIFSDSIRIKIVHAILENPENHNPRGAGLNLHRMVAEGTLTKCFVLHCNNTIRRLEMRWKNPKDAAFDEFTWGIRGQAATIAQSLFKPMPLQTVRSVHNREELHKPDVYKTQLPGIRDYFGEDIGFYFCFFQYYNRYLVYIAIIGFVAEVFEFITWTHDDDDSTFGERSDFRQAVLFIYMVALLIWQLSFTETLKRKVNRLSKMWGMSSFNRDESNRIEFRSAVVKRTYVDFKDLRIPILMPKEMLENVSADPLERALAEEKFYERVTRQKLRKLRAKRLGAKGPDGRPKYKHMLVDAMQPAIWGEGTYFNGVAKAAATRVNINALDRKHRDAKIGDVIEVIRGTIVAGREKRILEREGRSESVARAIVRDVKRYGCLAKCCCKKRDYVDVEFEDYFNVKFTEVPDPATGLPLSYDPWERRFFRMIVSWSVTAVLQLGVIFVMLGLIAWRIDATVTTTTVTTTVGSTTVTATVSEFDTSSSAVWYGILISFLTAALITYFNSLYSSIAVQLTEFENHRTETQFQTSRIAKVFIFQFITSFFTLFYAAFGKIANKKLFGLGPDVCMDNYFQDKPDSQNDCLFEVQYSVIVLFASMIVVSNLFEIGYGKMKELALKFIVKYCACCFSKKNESLKQFNRRYVLVLQKSHLMKQYFLDTYEGTFDDYAEIVIQYGYVTLFAVACPLSPCLALFNNYFVESWLDRKKLLHWRARPNLVGAQGMGNWMNILEIMGFMTVTTNVAIVVFTSRAFDGEYTASERVFLFLVLEHAFIILRIAIEYFAPDQATEVKVQKSREAMLYNKLVYSEQAHHHNDDDDDDGNNGGYSKAGAGLPHTTSVRQRRGRASTMTHEDEDTSAMMRRQRIRSMRLRAESSASSKSKDA